MTLVRLWLIWFGLFQLAQSFPLSFNVEKDNPLCFIERFDLGEVVLKENYLEL